MGGVGNKRRKKPIGRREKKKRKTRHPSAIGIERGGVGQIQSEHTHTLLSHLFRQGRRKNPCVAVAVVLRSVASFRAIKGDGGASGA